MTAKGLAELALKVWAVTLLVSALVAMPGYLWMLVAAPVTEQPALLDAAQLSFLLGVGSQVVAGVIVLLWADRIVSFVESDTTPLQLPWTLAELEVLGFGLVGLFILVGGLQDAAATTYLLRMAAGVDPDWRSNVWSQQGAELSRAAVKIVAGAFLVFGRAALVRLWLRLRGEPIPDHEPDEDREP